jgi:protein TonB
VNLRSFSTLQLALCASIAVHAVLLTVRFVDPESFNRVFKDTPLEVILVNSKTNEISDQPSAIAQTSLAGGGDAAQGRATSPLPPSALTDIGETQQETTTQMLQNLQEQQNLLLSDIKERLKAMALRDPRQATNKTDEADREEKQRQLVKLLAEIQRRIQTENARPKKRYISPATQEAAYAVYYDGVRSTIEDHGTTNFPQAGGKKLYGDLIMMITINHTGQVISAEVVETSGNTTLDRRASAIAQSAGPFGSFSKAMRREADQIVMTSRFKFTRDETLEAKVLGPQ